MTVSELSEAARILRRYAIESGADQSVSTEHDVIMAGSAAPDEMPPDESQRLVDLGWTWEEDYGCWKAFT